jgi:RNA polymerase sigma factor (sigma-70 family)
MSKSDGALVLAAQGGDVEAFTELVRRYETLVGAVAFSRTCDASSAEDVAQEAFVAAWRQRGELADPEKFRSWICAITRNQASSHRRRSGREVLVDELPDVEVTPSARERILDAERWQAVDHALGEIQEESREVLVLFYRQEQSIREVASCLGVTEAAAQKRISRARGLLRDKTHELLAETLPSTRFGASIAGAVAVAISDLPAATAAAITASGKGASTLKTTITVSSFVLLAAGAGAYLVGAGGGTELEAAPPVPKAKTQSTSVAKAASAVQTPQIQVRRISMAERKRRMSALPKASATSSSNANAAVAAKSRAHSDKSVIKATAAAVRPLLNECLDIAHEKDPALSGILFVRFEIAGEDGVLGLVNNASIKRRSGRLNPPNQELEECIEQTLLSLEFKGISRGASFTYPFRFNAEASHSARKSGELSKLVDRSNDPLELADLAQEAAEHDGALAMRACDKALAKGPRGVAAYGCTLIACKSGPKEKALGYWQHVALELKKEGNAWLKARLTCAARNVKLPPPKDPE